MSRRTLVTACLAIVIAAVAWFVFQREAPQELVGRSPALDAVTPADVQAGFAQAPASTGVPVVAAVMPHHLVAKAIMARSAARIASALPATVIIIGPDHENRGRTAASVSSQSWEWYGQVLPVATALNEALRAAPDVTVDDDVIRLEHSVLFPMPFLHEKLPNARFVLLALRADADVRSVQALARLLHERAGPDAVVVASVDFSHEVSPVVARQQDAASRAALESGNIAALQEVEADSPPALILALTFAQLRNARAFLVVEQSSAADIQQDPSQPTTTSYLTGEWGTP